MTYLRYIQGTDAIITDQVHITSIGKKFRVRAIFTDDFHANAYMSENPETGLIALFGPFLIIADLKETKA